MVARLVSLAVDARDPEAQARFWTELWTYDVGFDLRFVHTRVPKTTQNQTHFDLTSSSPADQQATVARALALGARHVDIGQRPDEPHVVLADPEGNEFCVIEAGNTFLAGCGFVGAVVCDGTRAVGTFWSAALGWPLVWDQDEETAIRSPSGGPKLTWGGYPYPHRAGRNRLRFEVAGDPDELLALGARHTDRPGELTDPDGNEFTVRAT